MKNLMIALLGAYIFYSQVCEVKVWFVIPVVAVMIFAVLCEIDDAIANHKAIQRRRKGIL